jgi:heme-degrading monooxygenase HmoA
MFARVTLLEIDVVRIGMDAAVEMYRTEVMPELKEQPGSAGATVLVTPEGKVLIMTLWETAEQADAGADARWYSETLERYVTMFRTPPGRELYAVAIADMPAAAHA